MFLFDPKKIQESWREHFLDDIGDDNMEVLLSGIAQTMPLDGGGCDCFSLAHVVFHSLGAGEGDMVN